MHLILSVGNTVLPRSCDSTVVKTKRERTLSSNDKFGSTPFNNMRLNRRYAINFQPRVSFRKLERKGTESCSRKTYLKYSGIMDYDVYVRRCPGSIQGHRELTAEYPCRR
jgi:hypothetical protein